VQGYQETGVIACGKHFPGHGDTDTDSHLALPTIRHSRERLEAVELAPFRAAIAAGIASLMTAHVFFPAYEPEAGRPATLSRNVLTGLLRERLWLPAARLSLLPHTPPRTSTSSRRSWLSWLRRTPARRCSRSATHRICVSAWRLPV
jgi:hypothetical protein